MFLISLCLIFSPSSFPPSLFTDLDRLYKLSFKRFSHSITHNIARGDASSSEPTTKLEICLDDDEDIVNGKDPLSSSQARRAWHAHRNARISEAAQTMYPKEMFHEDELVTDSSSSSKNNNNSSNNSSSNSNNTDPRSEELDPSLNAAAASNDDFFPVGGGGGGSKSKESGGEEDLKSTTFKRFEQSAILDCESDATSLLLFHPFEAVLVMSDLRDGLSVWNYGSGKKLSRFSNCNRPGTRITSLAWINEQEPTRLMTGSDDGVVRVWCGTSITEGGGVNEVEERQETVFQALEQAGFISGLESSADTTKSKTSLGLDHMSDSMNSALRKDLGMIDGSKSSKSKNGGSGGGSGGGGGGGGSGGGSGSGSGSGGGGTKSKSSSSNSGKKKNVKSAGRTGPAHMLTAWKGAHDINPGSRGSGLILKWQQLSGRLFAAGNSSVIRVWDMNREQCVTTIPSGCDTCVTAIGSDWNSHVGGGEGVVLCGYGDGSLRLFDARLPPEQAQTFGFFEHQTWVVNVEMQRGGGKHIISGSVSGDIKFWDIRGHRKSSIKTIELHRSPMTALAVHEFAPIVASGSHNQFIKIMDTGGYDDYLFSIFIFQHFFFSFFFSRPVSFFCCCFCCFCCFFFPSLLQNKLIHRNLISMIRYHEGFLGQRIGPVSCLQFHPHRPVLAAGATDSIVAIYSSRGKVRKV